MRWQLWLVDVPARIVDIWLRLYVVLMAIAGFVTIGALMALLVLWFGFGIRWGW